MKKKQTIVLIHKGQAYRMGPKHLIKFANDSLIGRAGDWTVYAEHIGEAITIPETTDAGATKTVMMRMTQMMNINDLE